MHNKYNIITVEIKQTQKKKNLHAYAHILQINSAVIEIKYE